MSWKNRGSSLLLAAALSVPLPVLAAPFQNGGFDSGFSGWQGQLDNFFDSEIVDPATSGYFDIVSGQAKVSMDGTWYSNTLFQDFTLEALLPGDSLILSFWIQWNPTDADSDLLSVILEEINGSDAVDLLDGLSDTALLAGTTVSQNITAFGQSWGGRDVELVFNITDMDFDTGDTLLLDDVRIARLPALVPEPPLLALLLLGMAGARRCLIPRQTDWGREAGED